MDNKNSNRMKIFLILFITIFSITNCSVKSDFLYYQGYIYNKNNIPVENIEVSEKEKPSQKTYTDKSGFFSLKKERNSISMFLILRKDNTILDSIQVIRKSGGEKINYYFVEGRNDTLFIDTKKLGTK